MSTTAERLASLRKLAGFPTAYAAEKAGGFGRGRIYSWELGIRTPESQSAARLAALYGVTVGQVLGTEPPARGPLMGCACPYTHQGLRCLTGDWNDLATYPDKDAKTAPDFDPYID